MEPRIVLGKDGSGHVLSYEHFKTILGLFGKGFDPRKFGINAYAIEAGCVKLYGVLARGTMVLSGR
jgi:hypothetical protein